MSADRTAGAATQPTPAVVTAGIVSPEGWAPPRGYSHGMTATGRVVSVAGQIGWDPVTLSFASDDFTAQAAQALRNIVTVLRAAGAGPEHLVRMTWYMVDRDEYVRARLALGKAYREAIGRHYPPMTAVFVSGLVEPRARVEIEAIAVVPA